MNGGNASSKKILFSVLSVFPFLIYETRLTSY